ncbi:GxxExxY protein [Chryseobacterium manosquense]|uniref:GxxExxY protein n=2 Tax=Chryseobacterium group TaxID=2782232 RepID=A0A246BCQ9_9FLAO|nr:MULTISPECIES: GxxExxY protein [Chryseobacterium group]OWK99468.1 GxxExxY protein [Kaistella haifensis DSM 19056]QNS40436.1 GxxExxY protein [Chryseobacterium manosquense]
MTENEISKIIFEAGLKIHRKIGIGLYETVYEQCLAYELKNSGLKVEKQKDISIEYESLLIEKAFRVDLLIEDKVIIEIKAVPEINSYHSYQLLNYLRISGCKLGMILNFHSVLFKDGVKRLANKL